jgi:hypothetical protein
MTQNKKDEFFRLVMMLIAGILLGITVAQIFNL